MDITQTRRYSCVICGRKEIVESIVEHTYEGTIPDISNCDLSTYSDRKVEGGKLLKNRPTVFWRSELSEWLERRSGKKKDPPLAGGICDDCLREESVKKLAEGGHILFDKAGR